ncbi:MAG: hypothetical protein ACYTBP_17700 [Planctomycetota bacterium]|jgi:hypothetical protein
MTIEEDSRRIQDIYRAILFAMADLKTVSRLRNEITDMKREIEKRSQGLDKSIMPFEEN